MLILGIETSCDETAAAIVKDGVEIVSNVVASSQEMHTKTGGIIPEQAAREQVKCMMPVLEEAIKDVTIESIDAIAVTYGPGLIGSLLVGIETAKTLAYVWKKPIVPVNHLAGHIYANFLDVAAASYAAINGHNKIVQLQEEDILKMRNHNIIFPVMVLIVSGGHTELVLMKGHGSFQFLGGTRDDAAGEAFDKVARILGLSYPGGPAIEKAAEKYSSSKAKSLKDNSSRWRSNNKLPRPMMDSGDFDFSFSGLKTAVLRIVYLVIPAERSESRNPENNSGSRVKPGMTDKSLISALAYETQEAITDVLVKKTIEAAEKYQVKSILLAGGVTANLRLRRKMEKAVEEVNSLDSGSNSLQNLSGMTLFIPPVQLCTDNAAYIASAAFFNYHPVNFKEIVVDPGLEIM